MSDCEIIRLGNDLAREFAEELVRFASDYEFSTLDSEFAREFGTPFPLLAEHVQFLRMTSVKF